jgi:hypothetical protein
VAPRAKADPVKISKLVDGLIECIKIALYAVFAFFLVAVACTIIFGEMTAIASVSFDLPNAISFPLHILLILILLGTVVCSPAPPLLAFIAPA